MQNTLNDFFGWFASRDAAWKQRPWLVLGKGPSFALAAEADRSGFNTFGLNHVVREMELDIAHIIDLDVIEQCSDVLMQNAAYVLMPWFPHVDHRPGKQPLSELVEDVPVLAWLASAGRLLWYNKTGSRTVVKMHGTSPPVRVVNFSAEAPYALLGMAGVKTIRSLGIDGGASYAASFSGLRTLLANGQPSFDRQFQEIAKSIMNYGIDAAPLNLSSPARVFVATAEEQMLSVKVLEYSIRKRASMSVEVIPMHASGIAIPMPIAAANWPRTPFSFQRFIIPKLAGYRGRAIYLDSDMQVFTDIRELWSHEMGDNQLLSVASSEREGRRPQYSVMLLDCERLQWNIDDIVKALDARELTYEDLMYRMKPASRQSPGIASEWNSLEYYSEGRTKLLHYTDMDTQPWIYARHPFGYIWMRDLLEAIEAGFITLEYVLDHVRKGWARPSLAFQVVNRIEDASLLPRDVLELDRHYSPPYHRLHHRAASPWKNGWFYTKAVVRRASGKLPLFALALRVSLALLRRVKRTIGRH